MKETTIEFYKQRMLKVLGYIEKHLDEELILEELAQVACFSPCHFHRIFTGMVGESLSQFIRRLRLERAARQLKQSQDSVIEIALGAGYETHEAFSRVFKQMYGKSPSQFRLNVYSISWLMAPTGVHYGEVSNINIFDQLIMKGTCMQVEIKKIEPIRVAYVRHVGPYNKCEKAWAKLCQVLGPMGLLGPKSQSRCIGLSYDDPEVTPPDKIRYDACITVGDDFQPQSGVEVQTIPAGEYAVTVHKGPYNTVGQTYAQLCGQWLPQHQREIRAAPSMEIYLNSPQETKPEELLTEIYVPLE